MIANAREFALIAHGDQKYGVHPYSHHLDTVAAIAAGYGEVAQVVAYLHDVVEDTDIDESEIERRFGRLVARCVAVLTDEAGKSRKERKRKTYAKMSAVRGEAEVALIVKVADRLANVAACVRDNHHRKLEMYRDEQASFRAAAYRDGLCDDLWCRLESALSGRSEKQRSKNEAEPE